MKKKILHSNSKVQLYNVPWKLKVFHLQIKNVTALRPYIAISKEPLKAFRVQFPPVSRCSLTALKDCLPLYPQLHTVSQLLDKLPVVSIALAHHTLTGQDLGLFQSMKN